MAEGNKWINHLRRTHALNVPAGPGTAHLISAWKDINESRGVPTLIRKARKMYKDYKDALNSNTELGIQRRRLAAMELEMSGVPEQIYDEDIYKFLTTETYGIDEIPSHPDMLIYFRADVAENNNNNNNNIIEDDVEPDEEVIIVEAQANGKKRKRLVKGSTRSNSAYFTRPQFEGESFDTSFVDYANYMDVAEDGFVEKTILNIPLDLTNGRDSNRIKVYKIDVKGTFKLDFGGDASPRILFFIDKQPGLTQSVITGKYHCNTRKQSDILSPDILSFQELVQEAEDGEIPDVLGFPTNMSNYNYTQTKSGLSDNIIILYDLYKDLNVQAIKGIVGEDIDSVPVKSTFKFTIDCDVDVIYHNEDPQSVIMNNISYMWLGDYDGGVVLGLLYVRAYYYSMLSR